MIRLLGLFGAVVFSIAVWIAVANAALFFLRQVRLLDPAALTASTLCLGGLALLTAGWLLIVAGMRHIDDHRGLAIARAGRAVVAMGALVMAAGSGAVLAITIGGVA